MLYLHYNYSYALNNPLRFTDPSGYYNKPSPHERDQINGEGYYYNNELTYKMAGLAGSQNFNSGADAYFFQYQMNQLIQSTPDNGMTQIDNNSGTMVKYSPVFGIATDFVSFNGFLECTYSSIGGDYFLNSAKYIDRLASNNGVPFDGPTPLGGYPTFEGNSGEISQWNPSGVHNWSRSKNFFAKLSYNLVDGVSVTAQSFFRGPNSVHLTGEMVKGYDRVDAFVNTASWALFAGEASSFNAINSGVYSSRWGLRIQAHTHPLSPLRGTGATGTMSPFHININNTHIIINPKYWKYYY